MREVNNFTVIGGGTAGCIAALCLKQAYPQKDVMIIESPTTGIIGVGESSTEHWGQFCRFVGINQLAPIFEANATFKVGVKFSKWGETDFMHSITDPMDAVRGTHFKHYASVISRNKPKDWLQTPRTWQNKFHLSHFNQVNESASQQYHFDTHALNRFLHHECNKRDIKVWTDDLKDAILDEDGYMAAVTSDTVEYRGDFFIDCTGFSRMFVGKKYGVNWKSYADYFPVNSAISFTTGEMEEYPKFTKATARKNGWNWQIPTQTRTGNGYVYSDKFTSKDEAHREMEEAYGESLEIAKEFKFEPGRLEKAWVKNCYAVGLSQSFVEPLEATSIGSSIQAMFCFLNYFPSWSAEECNKTINLIYENIAEYVQSHYLTKRIDTKFWESVRYDLKLLPGLAENLEKWKNRLPNTLDADCPWAMFRGVNYIPILYGLDWFDTHVIKREYINQNYSGIEGWLDGYREYESNESLWIGHKQLLNMLLTNTD